MKYTLTLKAVDDSGASADASVDLQFPLGAQFSVHTAVGAAFNSLVPLLLGEVAGKFEITEHEVYDVPEKELPTEVLPYV